MNDIDYRPRYWHGLQWMAAPGQKAHLVVPGYDVEGLCGRGSLAAEAVNPWREPHCKTCLRMLGNVTP